MTMSLIASCLWAFAATIVAFLPMRLQVPPGLALLFAAPVLVIWIGIDHGIWVAGLGVLAFVSMFRHPLVYLAKRVTSRAEGGATS